MTVSNQARIFLSVALTIVVFSLRAQHNAPVWCDFRMKENTARFEQWLHSKQIPATANSTTIYRIPVVVHVLHTGEQIGEGFNHSKARIESQIRTLNEDFRRKDGTPGFNVHPDGGDAQIEFILAQIDPAGNPTDGIVRVDRTKIVLPSDMSGDFVTVGSYFSYWNPDQYLNIWCMDLESLSGILFGSARFPVSDLEGLDVQSPEGDGVFINALNFGQGKTNTTPNYDKGRTLTHEVGHFLGLLHTFGSTSHDGQCGQYSDYCKDTPPIATPTSGCPASKPMACDGRVSMIENYMDYSHDQCMNIFTNDQISRMRIVLENSQRRKSLLTSPAIGRDPTGLGNDIAQRIKIYPNPATDKLFISSYEGTSEYKIKVTAYTLPGKVLFEKNFLMTDRPAEISIEEISEGMIILVVEGSALTTRQLIRIN